MGEAKRRRQPGNGPARLVPIDLLLATGTRAQKIGDAEAAERAYRDVLAADPTEPRAVQFLGALLVDREAIDEAIDLFEATLERAGPVSASTLGFYNNYANTLRRAGRHGSAAELLNEIIALAPDSWQPWHNLAQALKDMEQYDQAASAIRRCIMLDPSYGPSHGVLGEILYRQNRLHSATIALQRCLDLGAGADTNLWTVIGAVQRLLGNLEESAASLVRALELSGGTAAAHSNLGVTLTQLGRFDEAVSEFEHSIELAPDDHMVHSYLSYSLLTAGRLESAWDEWEHGILNGPRGKERGFDVARWTPGEADVRVMVYREQGVGDEILFASCYPDLIDAVREVIIECDPRVVPLFARSFPRALVRAQTIDKSGHETVQDFDRVLPAGSSPRYFRPTLDSFPDRRAFLVADTERVEQWRERLLALGPGPYVGISWRSKLQTAERRLEYSRLDEWSAIFAVPGVTWVNLQYDDCERELRDAEREFGIRIESWDWLDLMNDFDEVAALTVALDLVVAPHNAVACLSGALGVHTVTLGNHFGWTELGTDRFPWMPSIQLAHRMPNEEWTGVLHIAANEVAQVAERATSHA